MGKLVENTTVSVVNMSVTNATESFARDESLARVEIMLQIMIFVLAVLGNSTVLISLLLRKKQLTRMHLLMIHLSVADLFVAFGSVLPQIAWDVTFVFKGGDVLCRLVKYMQVVAIYASSYVLVMTAVDRYVAICYPFISRKWSSKMVHKLVLVAWVLSLLFSIPQTFIFSYMATPHGQMDCWASFEPSWTLPLYITIFTALVYILPTGILTFCYGNICIEVWRSSKVGVRLRLSKKKKNKAKVGRTPQTSVDNIVKDAASSVIEAKRDERHHTLHKHCDFQDFQSDTPSQMSMNGSVPNINSSHDDVTNQSRGGPFKSITSAVKTIRDRTTSDLASRASTDNRKSSVGLSRAKIKTVKMTLTVVLCYFLCWSPFFIAQMWAAWDESAPFYGAAYTIILLLASLNSCTNPWIYLLFSDSVCFEVKQCAYRMCRCKKGYKDAAVCDFR